MLLLATHKGMFGSSKSSAWLPVTSDSTPNSAAAFLAPQKMGYPLELPSYLVYERRSRGSGNHPPPYRHLTFFAIQIHVGAYFF